MTRRIVIVPLVPPRWVPPGTDPVAWRHALAEDAVDLLSTLAEVAPALAVLPEHRPVADRVTWPGTRVYELPALTTGAIFSAAGRDGYDQAVVLAPDAPDLPAMLIGKLLRPLTSRQVAVAPAATGGVLGLAARLPAAGWLAADLPADLMVDPEEVLRDAPTGAGHAARTPGWHRLTGPDGLARLDPAVEGWEATRALLSAG